MSIKPIIICILLGSLLTFSGCRVKANSDIPEDESPREVQESIYHFQEAIDGQLEEIDTVVSDSGAIIHKYTDDYYLYSVVDGSTVVFMISISDEQEKLLQKQFDSGEKLMIKQDKAQKKVESFISEMFPEYDLSELEFECDNETGIITEFYRFSVKETISGIRANIAEIDLAYSGEITFAVGSHNSKDKIEEIVDADGDLYDNSDAVKDAVFDFINSNKEEIKKNYEAEDEEMESEIVLSEEDALPDGFKPGDTITKTHLPEYEMVLSNREDIHNFHAEKIILNDRLFWECTGDIYTNWGEYDSSLNASFYLTIDNTTGEIENVSFTDSDLE